MRLKIDGKLLHEHLTEITQQQKNMFHEIQETSQDSDEMTQVYLWGIQATIGLLVLSTDAIMDKLTGGESNE